MWLPSGKGQWIAAAMMALVFLGYLKFFTSVLDGHAVEVSVRNDTGSEIFAYIDGGRYGNIEPVSMNTTEEKKAPNGLRIQQDGFRSFAHAVGLFDSPTLHVAPVVSGVVDLKNQKDCPFDTVPLATLLKKKELPSLHALLRWHGKGCEVSYSGPR